jgi:hypothetical protein
MRHEQAWPRLPDLLEGRDPDLLGHVRECADCERQLFLLGRVDRLLRDRPESRKPRRPLGRMGLLAATAATAPAVLLALFLPGQGSAHGFTLHTVAGRTVGLAKIGRSDGHNLSLAFTAHGLPVNRAHMLVVWTRASGASMEVGEFMVDASGGCRVHFNLPATHEWNQFWVAQPGNAAAIVASTDWGLK